MSEFDPDKLRKQLANIAKKNENDKLIITSNERWQDDNFKTEHQIAHAQGIRAREQNSEFRKKRSKTVAETNTKPERRAKHSASVTGAKHSQFKGYMIGTNIQTGIVEYRIAGKKEAEAAGFCYTHVLLCSQGKRKQHKGYIWTRE
jgi:hypothetical protein